MSLHIETLMPDYDYTIKDLFDIVLKYNLYDKLNIKNISDNIFLKEINTDILAIGTEEDIPELINKGYKEIEYENYINALVNSAVEYKTVQDYKINYIDNQFYINDLKITVSFKDNIINFTQHNPYKLIKSIKFDFNIKEFFVDDCGFVYIVTSENKLIKTHISLKFYKEYKEHECITTINDIEKFFVIEVPNIVKLLNCEDYKIQYLNTKKEVIEVTLGKKYYFKNNGQIFFNVIEETDKLTIQVEHTHFYDWISILGLNKFYIKDKKLSTKYNDAFKNIIKFKFDGTLNGMLNYSDFLDNKDYKIDIDKKFVKIQGNFNHEYKKGNYKIIVRATKTSEDKEVYFNADLIKDNECLKRISGNTVDRIMYFCNLKFIFYKEQYEDVIDINVSIEDDYSVKIVKALKYIDEKTMIDDFDDLSKIDQFFRRDSIKHQLIETDYENGHFIIKNYIKNSKERNFTGDFKIRFIEKDGTPSILWRQIKDKNYFLKLKNYLVTKTIKPRRTEKQLFNIERKSFKFNLNNITNKITE